MAQINDLSYQSPELPWQLSGLKKLKKKKIACQCRRHRFNIWSGRSPGEGNGNPLCTLAWEIPWTEDPVQAAVHGVTKESDMTQQKNNNNKTRVHEKTHQMTHWAGDKLLSFMKQDWWGNISKATKEAQLTFVG